MAVNTNPVREMETKAAIQALKEGKALALKFLRAAALHESAEALESVVFAKSTAREATERLSAIAAPLATIVNHPDHTDHFAWEGRRRVEIPWPAAWSELGHDPTWSAARQSLCNIVGTAREVVAILASRRADTPEARAAWREAREPWQAECSERIDAVMVALREVLA